MRAHQSRAGKTPLQVGDNRFRIGEPLAASGCIRDFQTRYLGLAAAAYQIRTVDLISLCITTFNRKRQTVHFLPNLDTEWAGPVLVKHKIAALPINAGLRGSLTDETFRTSDQFPKQHDRAKNDAHKFKEDFHEGTEIFGGGRQDICTLNPGKPGASMMATMP